MKLDDATEEGLYLDQDGGLYCLDDEGIWWGSIRQEFYRGAASDWPDLYPDDLPSEVHRLVPVGQKPAPLDDDEGEVPDAFPPGAVVRWTRRPTYSESDIEYGLVLRATAAGVFVRFGLTDAAQLCRREDLRVTVLPLEGWTRG